MSEARMTDALAARRSFYNVYQKDNRKGPVSSVSLPSL